MATVIKLTEQQIDDLLNDAAEIEQAFKAVYAELEDAQVSEATLLKYRLMHNRYSTSIGFLQRQRALAKGQD